MTDGRKLTREEIWRRIRETSKEEFILAEMKRLGFWPSGNPRPSLAESFVAERDRLGKRLRELSGELAQVSDPEEALRQMHKERKAAALVRREETRRKRNSERFQRASAWHARQQKEISWLGEGKYASLTRKELNHARLAAQSLPLIGNAAELAQAMGITIGELRFLCYQRDVSTISHYQRFSLPKKTGGERVISAPMPRLKRAQYWLLANVLEKIPVTDRAHGFVKRRNIVTNALPHVGKAVVVNLDLENFFPSISYARVKGIFRQLGYSEEVATLCAVLCTEAETATYELDGKRYFVKTGAAALPQGAPTSPALSNLLCRRLDKRMRGAAAKLGFEYTRYADDLTFSAAAPDNLAVKKLLWRVRKIVESEGLKIHGRKTHVMRKHQRQEVTGIVVNQKPSVCRDELRKFRALLFQIDKDGPEGKRWREGSLFNSIEGYANFVAMVNPEKGKPLQQRVAELRRKYQSPRKAVAAKPMGPENFRATAAAGKPPREKWWQARAKPAPVLELTAQEIREKEQREEAARAAEEAARNPKASSQSQGRWQTPPPSGTRRPEASSRPVWRSEPQPSVPPEGQQRPSGSKGSKVSWWWYFIALWAILQLIRHFTR